MPFLLPSLLLGEFLNWQPYPVRTLCGAHGQGPLFSSKDVFFTLTRTLFYHLSVLLLNIPRRFPSILWMWCALFISHLKLPFNSPTLFVIHKGPYRGHPASHSTVTRWICQLIIQAYDFRASFPLSQSKCTPVVQSALQILPGRCSGLSLYWL